MNRPAPLLLTPQGFTLIDALTCVALVGAIVTMSLSALDPWRERWRLTQARAAFESDWHHARALAQQGAQVLRLVPLSPCGQGQTPVSLGCGWRWVTHPQGQVMHQTSLPGGLAVISKPADGWQFDAWGDPLGGGASVLFQSTARPALSAQTLCLNLLGRLRRVGGTTCSD